MVIPAYNAEATLERCLDSLQRQSFAPFQLILVDDCSSDCTAALASSRGIEVVSFHDRAGPAEARNRGADISQGDVILFIDSDVVAPRDLLERMGDIFVSEDGVAAVQTLYSPDCPAEDMVSRYQNFYYFFALDRMESGSTATFATWCAAVRKDAFREAGGFNTSIPEPTVEDEELGYEIADRGGRILLAKDIRVTHLASYSLPQFISRRLRMARAQSKSGWRSFRDRLLRRYVNFRETGTHHSRWVVLSILLVTAVQVLLLSAAVAALLGSSAWRWLLPWSLAGLVLSQLCHLTFFGRAVSHFGAGILPGFVLMCILDMAVLGWGILQGTLQFMLGGKY